MFLDIHAHSTESSIFIYSPEPELMKDIVASRHFPMLLDEMSEYFNLKKCKYNNDKQKKNCARLGINRDY